MKKCPYCAEEIQDAAIVCRYCGRDLQLSKKAQQQIQKPPANKRSSLLLGFILVIIICCGVFRAITGNRTPGTPTAEPIVKGADSVVIITYTPAATHTAKPTSTPIPSRTAQPDVDVYVLSIQQKYAEFYEAYLAVNQYVQQAAEDSTLILDKDWKTETGLALGVLNFRADEMAKLVPSPAYENFHSYIVEIMEETHLFTEAYAKGIDNLDSESINRATEYTHNMATLMRSATVEIQRVNSNPSGAATVGPTRTRFPTKMFFPTNTPKTVATSAPDTGSGSGTGYDNNGDGKVTCADFQTQAAAQAAYNAGYTNLDGNDNDGKACESL